ncbi:MAG TPA: DNA primase [Micromonosporaceae bacterium]|nr:DNA primase [Micromonosporaceae bacterium]
MARHRADQPENALESDLDDEPDTDPTDPEDDAPDDRPAEIAEFWAELRVDPVEIALPRGVGYTLRAYRMSDTLPEVQEEAGTDDEDLDELWSAGSTASDRDRLDEDDEYDEDEEEDEAPDDDKDSDDEADDSDDQTDEEEDEDDKEPQPEEVPVFLTQGRRLLLFRSPEGLVDFVRSGESSSLLAIPEWDKLRSEISPERITASDEDRYELDLVVENLRGGHDAWDAELLIKAGQVCRDLGHALRMESMISALSPGSPLDDLDEALRDAESGRLAAFFARRKLRRIGAQQAALAWRSIIGKISTSVDWRD